MLIRSYKMKGFTMKYYNSKRFLSRIADGFGRTVLVAAGVFAVGAALTASAAGWTVDGVDYTALKAIKGNASGYIVTDITPVYTNIVKTKFKPYSTASGEGGLFCARGNKGANSFTCYRNKGTLRLDRKDQQRNCSDSVSAEETKLVADFGRNSVWLNDNKQTLKSTSSGGAAADWNTTEYTVASALAIFAMHNTLSSFSNKSPDYLYYFELYDTNTNLTHCLLPAQRGTDSKYGLFDTKTGMFYPQTAGTGFVAADQLARTVTAPSGCKKWIGRGDNKMSTGANWEGGNAPEPGDDLDLTLAPPLAEIDADLTGTYGTLYLDDGDIPSFTGSLTVSACNDRRARGISEIILPADDYTWNGNGSNWGDTGAWTLDNAAATWEDGNNAIFNTANATATLTADVEANALAFNADAAINGSSSIDVPSVSVASGVAATISAPTAYGLAKSGAGTLTLGASRSAATTLSEGSLVMTGSGTTLDWTQFTLGTDPLKPVTLRFEDGAALAAIPSSWYVGDVPGVTATFVKDGGDWAAPSDLVMGSKAGATTTFIHKGGTLSVARYFFLGRDASANLTTLEICGGTVSSTKTGGGCFMQIGKLSDARVVVTNGATFSVADRLVIGGEGNSAANGTLDIANGTVTVADDLLFGYTSTWSGTGTVNLGTDGMLQLHQVRFVAGAGYGNTFNFNGGTLKARSATTTFIKASDKLTVNVLAAGGIIDNNGKNITIEESLNGPGTINLIGSGAITFAAGVGAEGGVSVANGTTLTINGTSQSSFGSLTLAAGSTLDIANYDGTTPVSASALALPSEGTVNLKLNGGAFGKGIYAICAAQGVTAADGGKFSFSTENDLASSWSVEDGTLVLTVGIVDPNAWTGRGGDGRMSTAANWGGGEVPAAGANIDLSGISADTTIIADANRTFGAVTMGDGVITFTNSFAATSFSDTSKVAVGADSIVTIEGDLVFGSNVTACVCYSIAAGGMFAVTGDIIASAEHTGYVIPCIGQDSIPGTISCKGIVNNCGSSGDRFYLVRDTSDTLANWLVGEDGISGSKRFRIGNHNNSHANISARTNFTVSADIVQQRNLTLDTAGYTITLGTNTAAKAGGILPASSAGLTTIAGSGTVVANYNVDDLSPTATSKVGPFTVADGATLALKPGSNLGTGLLTVQSGATLAVPESGTVTLGGDLTLDDGAILAFNWTERAVAPQLALSSGKTMTVNGAVKVKIAEGSLRPTGGEKLLTTCGGFDAGTVTLAEDSPKWVRGLSVNDGNIVLDVKPMGTVILFR